MTALLLALAFIAGAACMGALWWLWWRDFDRYRGSQRAPVAADLRADR